MKKLLFISLFILSFYNCSSEKRGKVDSAEKTIEQTNTEKTSVTIKNIEGYFTSVNSDQTVMLVIKNQKEFEEKFHPAKTMANTITPINFDSEVVGSIILPSSEYETNIILDKAYKQDKTLHIPYSINTEKEKRTFTAIPQVLFSFDSSLEIDSISFDNNDSSIQLNL